MRKLTNPLIHAGIIAALAAAAVTAIGIVPSASAVGSTASTYVPIEPCRLADTRAKTAAD